MNTITDTQWKALKQLVSADSCRVYAWIDRQKMCQIHMNYMNDLSNWIYMSVVESAGDRATESYNLIHGYPWPAGRAKHILREIYERHLQNVQGELRTGDLRP